MLVRRWIETALALLPLGCTPTTEKHAASKPVEVGSSDVFEEQHLSNVVQLDAAGDASCALTAVGVVYCWGRFPVSRNDRQAAAPFGIDATRPVRVPGPPATRITVSSDSVAMVDTQGQLHVAGRFGDRRPTSESFEPTGVVGVKMVFKTPSTRAPLCWLDDEETVRCTTGERRRLPSGAFVDARSHNCFATADSVHCNDVNTMARSLSAPCADPRSSYRFSISGQPTALFNYNGRDVCALTSRGALYCGRTTTAECRSAEDPAPGCWKRGQRVLLPLARAGPYSGVAIGHHGTGLGYGLRSDGTVINFETITVVPKTGTLVAITTSSRHTCGLRQEGTVACWGLNEHGQLGNGRTAPRSSERPTATLVLAPRPGRDDPRDRLVHGPVPHGYWGARDAPPIDPTDLCSPLAPAPERPS